MNIEEAEASASEQSKTRGTRWVVCMAEGQISVMDRAQVLYCGDYLTVKSMYLDGVKVCDEVAGEVK